MLWALVACTTRALLFGTVLGTLFGMMQAIPEEDPTQLCALRCWGDHGAARRS